MSSPIGGFMPIPLAMMMPFMAAQSMLMGDAFGKGFQFGKRKISAMSNEEFNSLTMSNMVTDMQTEFKNIVPTIKQSIIDSRQVQNVIIEEMIKIVPEFLRFLTGQAITGTTAGIDQFAHALGTHVGHDVPPTQGPPAPPPPQIESRREPPLTQGPPEQKNETATLTTSHLSTKLLMTKLTISYVENLKAQKLVTFNRFIGNWIAIIKTMRANMNKANKANNTKLAKFYANIVIAIQTPLNKATGQFN